MNSMTKLTRTAGKIFLLIGILSGVLLFFEARTESSRTSSAQVEARQLRDSWEDLSKSGERKRGAVTGAVGWPFSSLEQIDGGMPQRLQKESGSFLASADMLKLRFNKARRAIVGMHRTQLWIVPGNAVICMFRTPRLAATCTTKVDAHQQGLVLGVYKVGRNPSQAPQRFSLFGLAPDDVRSVLVKAGSHERVLPVKKNVYFARARTPIELQAMYR